MIKLADFPQYLLFAESELESFQGQMLGRWRFVLQGVESAFRFDATDWEPAISLDRLDLLTIIRGLEELDQPSRVTIVTASKYVAHGFGFGLREWRLNDWKWERFGDMVSISNDDLWRRLDRASQFHQVSCRNGQIGRRDFEAPLAVAEGTSVRSAVGPREIRLRRRPARRWFRQLSRIASSIISI
jgi:ribonuclease HI